MTLFKTLGFVAVTLLLFRVGDFLLTLINKPSDFLVGVGLLGLVAAAFLYYYIVRFILRGKKTAQNESH